LRASFLVPLALLLCATPARAQQPVTRADSADVLVAAAERLQAQGSEELAAALARMVERRYADTPAATRAAAVLANVRSTRASRAGRVGLIAFGTIYGAWLGVAVPAMLEAESPEAYGIGLLTAAPAGFFAARAFTRNRSISAGDAGVVSWSALWGTWQGLGWQLAGDIGESCRQIDVDVVVCDSDASAPFAMMVAGGLLGLGASAYAADRTDIGGGTAAMIGWGSLWGTGGGLVTSVLADLGDDQEPLIAALIGGDLGFLAMAVLAPAWDMSSGRAWLVNAAGIMGGAIGGGIDLLLLPDDEDIAVLIPTIGSAAGLWIGAHLTRHMDEGRVREGRGGDVRDGADALVRLSSGTWRLAFPLPTPALLPRAGARGELAVRVPLLDARF